MTRNDEYTPVGSRFIATPPVVQRVPAKRVVATPPRYVWGAPLIVIPRDGRFLIIPAHDYVVRQTPIVENGGALRQAAFDFEAVSRPLATMRIVKKTADVYDGF